MFGQDSSRNKNQTTAIEELHRLWRCYSWISWMFEVALVAFVRKCFCEIQYLKTTISDQQREEFGRMVPA